jgi:uncharacterized protein YndB with AHSA1/START domain
MNPDRAATEVRRRFAAAPEAVFSAFCEAHLVKCWLSPSPEIALTVLQFDFRVGGVYRFAYDLPGGQTMIVNGAYRSIERPSKIVFSWNIEPPDEHAGLKSEVTVTITPDGTGAELLIRHEKLTRAGAAERHAGGWRGALDQLTTLIDAGLAAAALQPVQSKGKRR